MQSFIPATTFARETGVNADYQNVFQKALKGIRQQQQLSADIINNNCTAMNLCQIMLIHTAHNALSDNALLYF